MRLSLMKAAHADGGGAPWQESGSPGFPVDLVGVGELHAAFLNESRTRRRWWRPVAGNPGRPSFSAHVRFGERGAPVRFTSISQWPPTLISFDFPMASGVRWKD